MALKVKANEKLQKIGTFAGTYRYVMMPELYNTLSSDKVIKEAALRSGIAKGSINAAWDAIGEVIKAWATEGHSVAIPGLGSMRFGLRAKSVADVNEVKTSLIRSRRIIFTPDVDLKDELAKTSVQITCYDRNGEVFVLGSHLDFRVLLLFTYFIFSIGLALCIAEPVSKSGRYFLRVEGPIKTMEIALYKWFDAAPHQSVTIGKSVNCNLQMSWDLNGNIAPLQAEIKTDGIAIFLHVVEEGVELPGKQLVAGKSVQLYHQSQFRIGQTTFTYIEKDLC